MHPKANGARVHSILEIGIILGLLVLQPTTIYKKHHLGTLLIIICQGWYIPQPWREQEHMQLPQLKFYNKDLDVDLFNKKFRKIASKSLLWVLVCK